MVTPSSKVCINCGYPAIDKPWCPLCHSIGDWYPIELIASASLIILSLLFTFVIFRLSLLFNSQNSTPTVVVSTLTIMSTVTPISSPTATWTSTPNLAAIITKNEQRIQMAVARTLTAQPLPTRMSPLATPTPIIEKPTIERCSLKIFGWLCFSR